MNHNLDHLIPSGIRRFTALAKSTPGCKMLTIGEPDFDTPLPIREAATKALADGLTHYAPNRGTDSLREAIAAYETMRGMACTPEQVLVTVGATGALNTALSGILNPGDEVIIPTPAFSLYESIVLSLGAKPVFLPLKDTGFQIRLEELREKVTDKTRAIILNSPNNPTGAVLDPESLSTVVRVAVPKGIFLICDNVYAPLCPSPIPDLTRNPALRDRVILCQSFSKPWAMTGWRIGYLVAPEDMVDKFVLLQAAQIASVPTFIQKAAETALMVPVTEMSAVYAGRRAYAQQRLTTMGLTFPKPEGAFYLFPDISHTGLDSETFCARAIREAGVACVPGSCFSCEGHIRISYCYSDRDLKEGLDRLEAFLKTL